MLEGVVEWSPFFDSQPEQPSPAALARKAENTRDNSLVIPFHPMPFALVIDTADHPWGITAVLPPQDRVVLKSSLLSLI